MKTKRKIIKIDEEKCDGCGNCIPNCPEGALRVIDGKARLVSDLLCDGLGACLGDCPKGAITLEEREAAHKPGVPCGCPGAREMTFGGEDGAGEPGGTTAVGSRLRQWPVQLHLVSPMAPYFKKADVVLAADCAAYAYGDFHNGFLKGKALAIACPKLDDGQESYLEKLNALVNDACINTLTVVTMEVPCCGGLLQLARAALAAAKRKVPLRHVVIGLQGAIKTDEWV